ncbi:MAG: SpoIIE family protein phosphatase [Chlorobi bacterium]|nr:SpoIIE family protein phosphatase [Chlorobiota bacterium]
MKLRHSVYLNRILVFTFFIIIAFSASAQEGSPFITNYKLNNKYKLNNWFIIQGKKQQMFFANQKGILSFDGSAWDIIPTPAMPLTMYSDTADNKIYAGCVNDVGYLDRDTTGIQVFVSIKKSSENIGKVIEISSLENKLIVVSENFITIYNTDDYTVVKQISNFKNNKQITGIINQSDKLFFVSEDNTFYKLKNDSLYYQSIKNKNNIGKIIFDFPISKTKTLIGTTNNKLYYFSGKSVWQFNIRDQKYLDESILTNAVRLTNTKIALSTLIGGILIIDSKTRKTVKNINYSSGLPDNEIFAIGKDDNNGLWLSHGLGISRIDFSVPVKLYSSYPGIEGRLLSVININNTLYVGTNENLFFLEELDAYKRARLIESEIKTVSKKLKTKKRIKAKEDAKKKGLFAGLHKKIRDFVSPDNTINLSERKRNSLIRKRKLLGMQSVSHSYKKIENLNDRCKILVPYGNELLVGGNNGVYLIKDKEAEHIISDRYINNIIPSKNNSNLFYVCTNNGLLILEFNEDEIKVSEVNKLKGNNVTSVSANDTAVWVGTTGDIYLLNFDNTEIKSYKINNKYEEPALIQEFENIIYILLPSKVLAYSEKQGSIIILGSKELSFIKTQVDVLWMHENNSWNSLIYTKNYDCKNNIYLNLFDNIEYLYVDKLNDTWVIDDKNNLYKINNLNVSFYNPKQNLFIKTVTNQKGEKYSLTDISLNADENNIKIILSAPFFIKQDAVEYQYFLEGLMKNRSGWGKNNEISFPYLPHGKYIFHVKAKNILNSISEEEKITFYVKEAFWEKDWFLISSGLFLVLIVILIIKMRERKLKKNQKLLEQKINERTKTIEEQRNQIAKSHKSIKDSIVYAKRIQQAMMPSKNILDKSLKDYFVFFKPRDIVSGDFYWIKQIREYTVYAVGDCTGHGVPGAMLSMLGISFLSEIVTKVRFDTPDEFLNRLRKKIKSSLNQTSAGIESKDGMDIALCIIDNEGMQLQFAGAFNPAYIIREGELTELKANRNPIGIHHKETPFQYQKFELKKNDMIYTFSDGYSDQFGHNNQKFNKHNFKKLLLKIYNKPMSEQKEILKEILTKWKGEFEQTDDIIVMGVRI